MNENQKQQISPFLDAIRLKEKTIEPDKQITPFVTRNIQLGQIGKKESLFLSHSMSKSIEMLHFPHDEGGWLTHEISKRNMQKIESQIVLSVSVDGFGRRELSTERTDQTIQDKSKKSFFGSLVGGKQ